MATRFLSSARTDVKKAMKSMQATQEWRSAYFRDGPLRDESILEDLNLGIVYFSGRDSELRPTLVVRACRIPQQWYKEKRVDRLIRLLVFCMEYMLRYMLVPGRIENLCVIVDLKGIGFSQVSVGALSDVYKVMSHHYSGRVFRFFIANLPTCLSMIAGMAKALLTDRQKQKLVVLRDVKELQKHFALHQLEDDLGGSRPCFSEFYPFPLQAGPFECGFAGGADQLAVPYVYKALKADAVIGRLWNPEKSWEDNVCIELDAEAEPILEACGVSLSPSPAAANGSPGAASFRWFVGEANAQGESMELRRVRSSSERSTKEDMHDFSTEGGSSVGLDHTSSESSAGVDHVLADQVPDRESRRFSTAVRRVKEDGWEAIGTSPEIEASVVCGRFGCWPCSPPLSAPCRGSTLLSL